MFAANTELESGAARPAALRRDCYQFADAIRIEAYEGIAGDQALFQVLVQKCSGVVAAQSQGRLGEVVCAKREELGYLRDLTCPESSARKLYHRADHVIRERTALASHRRRDISN